MEFATETSKTYLVTGGAGFIGSEFIRKRCNRRDFKKIYIIDKLTYAADLQRISNELQCENVELIESDVSDTNFVYDRIRQ